MPIVLRVNALHDIHDNEVLRGQNAEETADALGRQ